MLLLRAFAEPATAMLAAAAAALAVRRQFGSSGLLVLQYWMQHQCLML
jgi:hypothetical protein